MKQTIEFAKDIALSILHLVWWVAWIILTLWIVYLAVFLFIKILPFPF